MQCKRSHERNQRIAAMDSATRVVPNGNAEDCNKALTRYCAATSAAMLLDDDPEETMRNIDEFCYVSDERKGELRNAWDRVMGDGRPLPACACCGVRDLEEQYERECVADLPFYFQYDAQRQHEFELLKAGVRLMEESGQLSSASTDLSVIISSYLAKNGVRYHLHSELVDPAEQIDVCVVCLQLIRHENEPVGLDDSDEDKSRRKRRSMQLANASRSIAAGYDLGVLSRISGLDVPSHLELALLSPNRSYMVTIKVSNQNGLRGAKSLRGDCIVFTHEGPAESIKLLQQIGQNVEQRIQWIRDGGNFRVVLVGNDGQAEKFIHDNGILLARPHVIFNMLRIYSQINQALNPGHEGDPNPFDETYKKDFVLPLKDLGELVFKNARILGDNAAGIDAVAQMRAKDVASVREPTTEGFMASVGLMSSSNEPPKDPEGAMFLTAVETMLGRRVVTPSSGSDKHDSHNESGGKADEIDDDGTDESEEQQANCENTDSHAELSCAPVKGKGGIAARVERPGCSRLRRSSEPICEFRDNGLNIMKLFRNVFPLMRISRNGASLGPLKAMGKLSTKERRHVFLQFSGVAASNPVLHHFLANQTRRHSVIIAALVRAGCVTKFEKLVNSIGFNESLAKAVEDPSNLESKKLQRKISTVLIQAGKDKPWGCAERANVKPLLLAHKERFGTASVFLTVALDDTHDIDTIRMTFPTRHREGFPGFAGDDEKKQFKMMMDALRNGGKLDTGPDTSVELTEGKLQRQVADNPTAAASSYHHKMRKLIKILLQTNGSSKRTVPIFEQRDGHLCRTKEAEQKGLGSGIFGQTLAYVGVTEVSGRKALHMHMIAWTASSPEFLAKLAASGRLWNSLSEALSTQMRGEVGLEVHVFHGLQQVLRVKPPRATFTRTIFCSHEDHSGASAVTDSLADEEAREPDDKNSAEHSSPHNGDGDGHTVSHNAALLKEGLAAVGLNNHNHGFACHNNRSGKYACRLSKPAGHPVYESLVQLNGPKDVPEDAVLCGDHGSPMWCEQLATGCCSCNWPGKDDSEEVEQGNKYCSIILTKPTQQPAFPNGEDLVSSARACIFPTF